MAVFVSMFLFALVGSISPGPVNVIATGTGANFGFLRALPHVLGATLAYTLIVFLVGIGLNGVLAAVPQITTSLQYLGGAFLLWMAYKIGTARPVREAGFARHRRSLLPMNKGSHREFPWASFLIPHSTSPPTLLEGAFAQGLNPKAWLVSMSGVSLFVVTNAPALLYLLAFCLISFVVCLLGVGTWAAAGHLIGKLLLGSERRQVAFNRVMGLLLCGTVAIIFLNQ